MDAIIANTKDPAWWFSAFIVAIIASIIAGFFKDWLERRFGLFLRWSRDARDRARANRAAIIEAWSSSEGLLAIALLHMLYLVITFIALCLAVSLMGLHLELKYGDKPLTSIAQLSPRKAVAFAVGWVAVFVYGVRVFQIVGRSQEAISAFRTNRNLPQFAKEE